MTERHQVTYRIPRTAAPKETRGRAPAYANASMHSSASSASESVLVLESSSGRPQSLSSSHFSSSAGHRPLILYLFTVYIYSVKPYSIEKPLGF